MRRMSMLRRVETVELFISLNVMLVVEYMEVFMRRQMESPDFRLADAEIQNLPNIQMVCLVSRDFTRAIKLTKQNQTMSL